MTNYFNLLVTSISKKVPLIKAVRQSIGNLNLHAKIFGGDSSSDCIAKYFVDEFWQMPLQNTLSIEAVISYCKQNEIRAIIPTRDGELLFFSNYLEILANEGISCMISPHKTIETCINKLLFYQFLSKCHLPVIYTTTDIDSLPASTYVVKECFGSGSQKIGLNLDSNQAKTWSKNLKNPVFQPFIKGKEYSVDVYINREKTSQAAIARTRELLIDGESQITSSINHREMEDLCLTAAIHLGIYGHAVFQILHDSANHLHLIECNARFGGASTLSIAMGLQSFEWFLQESLKQPLSSFVRNPSEMKQIRYPEDKIFPL